MNTTMQRINILKGQCQIDEETWRDSILPRFGATPDGNGRVSLKSVPFAKQEELLKELQAKAPKTVTEDWRAKRIAKIRVMWGLMHDAGIVRDASERAMRVWCAKATKVERLEWAQAAKLDACIEGMKAWAKREGFGVRYVDEHRHTELYRL
jgi:hypothetical protein